MVVVGDLIQIMTLSGVRGLSPCGGHSAADGSLLLLWLILPISEGMLQYAVALFSACR